MPYAEDKAGIYRVVDQTTGTCYVGQSKNLKKRIAEHFRLLSHGRHPNPQLQEAYTKSGRESFRAEIEAYCDDPQDMDTIEEAFLTGEAWFNASVALFNISSTARRPMFGREHTEDTKTSISLSKRGRREHVTEEYRKKLSEAQVRRSLSDPDRFQRIKFIVQNPHLSYAERGRRVGVDTGTARRLALRYANLKEFSNG